MIAAAAPSRRATAPGDSFAIPRLHAGDLVLRAPVPADMDAMAAFCASDRAQFIGGPWDRDDAWRHLCGMAGQWAIRGYGRWLVADRTTDEALGLVGLHHPDAWPEPELAWIVFETAEGRGIAHKAAIAARAYAYDTLGWTTLVSHVEPENTRSMRLAERLGCRPDGTFAHKQHILTIMRHPAPAEVAQ